MNDILSQGRGRWISARHGAALAGKAQRNGTVS